MVLVLGLLYWRDLLELDVFIRRFIEARLLHEEDVARAAAEPFLTQEALEEYDAREVSLWPVSNPHFSRYNVLSRRPLEGGGWYVRIRIFDEYTDFGEIGYFDEELLVRREGPSYRIYGVDIGDYVNLGN